LTTHLDRYVVDHRRKVFASLKNWWDKYAVSLDEIEAQRAAASLQLDAHLQELGYA
jgi:type I restriction enzyme M protein